MILVRNLKRCSRDVTTMQLKARLDTNDSTTHQASLALCSLTEDEAPWPFEGLHVDESHLTYCRCYGYVFG